MKTILTIAVSFFSFLNLGNTQILDLIFAEKFDFQDVFFDADTGFDPTIMCNDSSDLSYYEVDFDPNGNINGSIFFADDEEVEYAGTFFGDSDVRLLDVNINHETEHQTILLDLSGSCNFINDDDDTLQFDFPVMENMSGIINFSDESGVDSFWNTYILSTELRFQHLWSVGDLTLISGSASENLLQYVNPDTTVQDIEVFDSYNHYIIAIDKSGYYQWSHVTHSSETGLSLAQVKGVEIQGEEILILTTELDFNGDRRSKLTYLDIEGNETQNAIDFPWIVMNQFDIANDGSMLICGAYDEDSKDTNLDLNGGEYFLESTTDELNSFIIKYDPESNIEWVRKIVGPTNNFILSFDRFSDHIYFTGQISQGSIFDVDENNTMQFDDINDFQVFISKYSEDGTMKWTVPFGNENFAVGLEVILLGNEIGLFGSFVSDIDADPDPSSEVILTNENPELPRSHFFLIFDENPVNTYELDNQSAVLRPNPTSAYLDTGDKNIAIVEIKDLTGRVVGRYNSSNVDVSNLQNGMYVVTLEHDGLWSSELISVVH